MDEGLANPWIGGDQDLGPEGRLTGFGGPGMQGEGLDGVYGTLHPDNEGISRRQGPTGRRGPGS